MNYRAMAHYLGLVLKLEAALMLPAFLVSAYYGETDMMRSFVISAAAIFAAGVFCGAFKQKDTAIRLRESYILIAVCWLVMALMGALPYRLSGEMGSLVDCIFESVSGFTTTAASVLQNVESRPRGLIFWRSFSLWIGGMGVLLLLTAVQAAGWEEGSSQALGAENPGPVPGKLAPKLRDSARILYGIYLGLTVTELLLLVAGGMPLYDSAITALSTAGTGGFTARSDSIAAYGSFYLEAVTAAFMLLCGMNFNIHYLLLARKFMGIKRNEELRAYLFIIAAASVMVGANLYRSVYPNLLQAARYGVFQVVSVVTTTGFQTADFGAWPEFSRVVLFMLMFVGGCAGSSAGGLKVARVMLLMKEARRSLYKTANTRTVSIVTLDGKAVDMTTLHAANIYVILYCMVFVAAFLLISLDDLDFESTASVVAACFNNIGAGFGIMNETGSYAIFSPRSKLVLSGAMLLGRLEIFPILLMFSPRAWRRL